MSSPMLSNRCAPRLATMSAHPRAPNSLRLYRHAVFGHAQRLQPRHTGPSTRRRRTRIDSPRTLQRARLRCAITKSHRSRLALSPRRPRSVAGSSQSCGAFCGSLVFLFRWLLGRQPHDLRCPALNSHPFTISKPPQSHWHPHDEPSDLRTASWVTTSNPNRRPINWPPPAPPSSRRNWP